MLNSVKFCSVIALLEMFSCWVTLGSIPCPPTWQTFQGTGYYVHSVPMAWAQAKEFCQKMGGNLLMRKSSEENAFANSLLEQRGATTVWLNCHRDGRWLCEVNGVAMWPPFNNPAPDQPTPDGNCLTMKAKDGKWRHTYCDLKATTVCEREATVQPAGRAPTCTA